MDETTLTYSVWGREVNPPRTMNYEQLQQFCFDRGMVARPLINTALSGDTQKKYRGYWISAVQQES